MKAKLVVNSKELEVEISEEQLKALESKQPKHTGYERVGKGEQYFLTTEVWIGSVFEQDIAYDNARYNTANYYSDQTVAENNARADKLMRQLRRFAVEHRVKAIDWDDYYQCKYFIQFNVEKREISCDYQVFYPRVGLIYFDREETAELAIKTFKDELMWYFTEYKDCV